MDTENEFTKKQFYETGKKTYYIDENGRIAEGWQKIKGKYYYFNRDSGILMRKCNVDGIKIGKSGVAKASKENIEKIKTMITARKIMLKVTSPFDTKKEKLKKCFKWIFPFPYKRYRLMKPIMNKSGWETTFANDIFEKKSGCCVSDAAAFAFLAKEVGYKEVYICHDTGHGWTEIDGRVYDPLFAEARGFNKYYNVSYKSYRLHPVGRRKV